MAINNKEEIENLVLDNFSMINKLSKKTKQIKYVITTESICDIIFTSPYRGYLEV